MANREPLKTPLVDDRLQAAQLRAVTDGISALVYVADMNTHEVLFINRAARQIFGDIVGRPCWASIQQGQTGPCPFCTNAQLLDTQGQPREPIVWEFCNTITHRWYECHDRAVPWSDGRFVRLEIATDITERKRADAYVRANEDRLDFLLQLAQQAGELTEEQVCDRALAKAVALTASRVGYVQFVNLSEVPTSLSRFYEQVPPQLEKPAAATPPAHREEYVYPAERKGRPAGQIPAARRLTATVVDRDRAQMVLGVGDKEFDYTQDDAVQLQRMADGLMRIVVRHRVEAALKVSQERFRFIVEGTNAIAWELDVATFLFTYVSPQAERILGYPISDWYQEGFWANHIHPDDREFAVEYCSRSTQQGEDHSFDYRMIKADGSTIWMHDVVAVIKNEAHEPVALRGLMLDITDRKDVEADLMLGGMVFKTVNEGMLVTDAQANIISVNPAFERITGYRADEVLGRNPRFLQSGLQKKPFYEALWTDLTQSGRWEGELWNRRKTGECYAERLSVVAIPDERGRTTNYLGVFNDITLQRRQSEALRYQADHDGLTGLINRRLAFDRLSQALIRAERQGSNVALLMLDLDGFKQVNDLFGHAAGDLILVEAGRRLTSCVRESDTVARFGGDEFLILLPEIANRSDVEMVTDKVRASFDAAWLLEDASVSLNAAIGVATFPDDGSSPEELVKKADAAMYAAKKSDRTPVRGQIYFPSRAKRR